MLEKKSKEANLERKKSLFFYIGLIVTLALTFIAFEWGYTQYETPESEAIADLEEEHTWSGDIVVVDDIPPKPEPHQLVRKMEKDEPDRIIDHTKLKRVSDQREPTTFSSSDPNDINPEEIPEELFHFEDFDDFESPIIDPFAGTIVKNVTSIDQRPYFPECCTNGYSPLCYDCTRDKIFQHIREQIKVPDCIQQAGGFQLIWVKLTIEVDGSVESVEVMNMDEVCTEAAVRTRDALSRLPQMIPGEYAGMPVRVSYHIPVKLRFM